MWQIVGIISRYWFMCFDTSFNCVFWGFLVIFLSDCWSRILAAAVPSRFYTWVQPVQEAIPDLSPYNTFYMRSAFSSSCRIGQVMSPRSVSRDRGCDQCRKRGRSQATHCSALLCSETLPPALQPIKRHVNCLSDGSSKTPAECVCDLCCRHNLTLTCIFLLPSSFSISSLTFSALGLHLYVEDFL